MLVHAVAWINARVSSCGLDAAAAAAARTVSLWNRWSLIASAEIGSSSSVSGLLI